MNQELIGQTPEPHKAYGVIGERGQIVIPKAIRAELGLRPRDKVEFILQRGQLTVRRKRDLSSVEAAFTKWGGSGRAQMLADGYKTVDEMIEDMRGR